MIQLPDKSTQQQSVRLISVSDEESGQRLDNYLLRLLNGVPKTRVYKAVRKGEVRVNKGRAKPDTRLEAGDVVRVPPFREAEKGAPKAANNLWAHRIRDSIVLDEKNLLVINKPSGLAVHGGSGVNAGLIETLRVMYPEQRYMELVHRLDRDTSGLIMIARRASTLRALHAMLREDHIDKRYQALVIGRWPAHINHIDAPLEKFSLASGERMVRVSAEGKRARTDVRVLKRWKSATLIEAKPVTGRTHQIRVHVRHAGHPILGDSKYASPEADGLARQLGLRRLFLHAASLNFALTEERYRLTAELDGELSSVCERLSAIESGN